MKLEKRKTKEKYGLKKKKNLILKQINSQHIQRQTEQQKKKKIELVPFFSCFQLNNYQCIKVGFVFIKSIKEAFPFLMCIFLATNV